MQYNRNKPVKIQTTWTRTEVADMYGICARTLDNWLKDANYALRPHKAITFKQKEEIFALFGDPTAYVKAESEKLAQQERQKNK
jgi:phage antirepressor YoqD-like protein